MKGAKRRQGTANRREAEHSVLEGRELMKQPYLSRIRLLVE